MSEFKVGDFVIIEDDPIARLMKIVGKVGVITSIFIDIFDIKNYEVELDNGTGMCRLVGLNPPMRLLNKNKYLI